MKIEINITEKQINGVLSFLELCGVVNKDLEKIEGHENDVVDITESVMKSQELKLGIMLLAIEKIVESHQEKEVI